MPNAFDLTEQFSDVVIGNPCGWAAHCSRFDLEGFTLLDGSTLRERHSKSFVHYGLEWTPSPPRFSLKPGSDIIVQG